nr:MAG TPA: hypothetical protein [Caudoviricetes sp.]
MLIFINSIKVIYYYKYHRLGIYVFNISYSRYVSII